jgi:hypothetical protein
MFFRNFLKMTKFTKKIFIPAFFNILKKPSLLVQGVSSLNVFFETTARICNYDIFDNWELAVWSQGFTICVLFLGFHFNNVTWPPQPLILMASMISCFLVMSESFGVIIKWFLACPTFWQKAFEFQSKIFKSPDF